MKLFIGGLDTLSLQTLFGRIKPKRACVDAAYCNNYKFPFVPEELMLTCSVGRFDDEIRFDKKLQKLIKLIHLYHDRIEQIVLPSKIPFQTESLQEVLKLCESYQTFYPIEYGRDISFSGKPSDVERLFSRNPDIRKKQRKVHLSQAFGNEYHQLPLYSLDSTLWRRGAEYGSVLDYKDVFQLVRVVNGNEEDKLQRIFHLRPKWNTFGFDTTLIEQSHSYELAAWNMFCMEQYASDLYVKALGQAYWMTNEERKRIINEFRKT